tara:strand:- start:472 stop:687 length:216 start_codon:yes stop_codon:yes gene_type:complete
MTKIISISDDAYKELAKLKNGLSFSRVIIALTKIKRRESIMSFAGLITKKEGDNLLKGIKDGRKEISRRML